MTESSSEMQTKETTTPSIGLPVVDSSVLDIDWLPSGKTIGESTCGRTSSSSSSRRSDIELPDEEQKSQQQEQEQQEEEESSRHSKWAWLHAAYHFLVTIVGTGILGFPYATASLGYAGSVLLITAITAASYYTAILLSHLQQPHHGTYAEIANDVMGRPEFAKRWIQPFQFLNFFPATAVMILVGGEAMATMDSMSHDNNDPALEQNLWTIIMGVLVLILSMAPDLNHIWQLSAVGCVAVLMITAYCIVGSSVALAVADSTVEPEYGRPSNESTADFAFSVTTAFGSILFGYGFHAVLPNIQASLNEKCSRNVHENTKKAVVAVFSYSYPAYLVVAVLGYAAFGSDVQENLLMSITDILSDAAMFVIWAFVIVKTATEATVYNQVAFAMVRDKLGVSVDDDHANYHPKNRIVDGIIRVVWVVAATAVATFVPYFSDLTSITAAVSITPISFVFPILLWNKKNGHEARRWIIIFHYLIILVSVLLSIAALVGAVENICRNIAEGRDS